jgi:hypothetical protein
MVTRAAGADGMGDGVNLGAAFDADDVDGADTACGVDDADEADTAFCVDKVDDSGAELGASFIGSD